MAEDPHAETVDGLLVGIVGAVNRPDAAVVRRADDREVVTSLEAGQAVQVATTVARRLDPATEEGGIRRVKAP